MRKLFKELGPFNGILYLFDRALRAISAGRARLIRYVIVAQPVPDAGETAVRPSKTSAVREVDIADPVVPNLPRPPDVISHRFSAGATCYVAEVKGRFAGFLWLAFDGYDEDEVRCRYEFKDPASSAWDYDVYVEPEFRLGRTFVRLWQAANRRLCENGIRWSYSRISAFNAVSLASHRRMGMRRLFSATFICIGPAQMMFAGVRPFVHLSFSSDSRPIIYLGIDRAG